ncbi:MAG: hypothetical protein ABL866_09200 [Devosia sp.]
MSAIRAAIGIASLAVAASRHPAVRATLRAAPLLVTPKMRAAAADATLEAAFRAGVLARKITRRP